MVSVSRSDRSASAQIFASGRCSGSSEVQQPLGYPHCPLPPHGPPNRYEMFSSGSSSTPKRSRQAAQHGLQPAENSQDLLTGIQLRFPWGVRMVAHPVTVESFTPREASYLNWLFRSGFHHEETKANHLLFTALPQSSYQGKVIRERKSMKPRMDQWLTRGFI